VCKRSFLLFELTSALPDPTWVGDGEFVKGLAPAHDALPFDEAGGLVAALASLGAAGGALAGSFVLDVEDGEPQQLDGGVVGGEVAAGLGHFPQLVVQGLALVVYSSFRTGGVKARNGVKRSQAASQTLTACGYFWPGSDAAKPVRASRAASASGAV